MRDKVFDHGEISGFLDEGTSFSGELSFRNTMRIDGKFKGKIKSKNVLIVGETAEIDGEVDVSNISVNGKVSGKIIADKKIEIHSKGRVYCDIDTPKLVIEDGAFFQGKCNMDSPGAKDQPSLKPDAAFERFALGSGGSGGEKAEADKAGDKGQKERPAERLKKKG